MLDHKVRFVIEFVTMLFYVMFYCSMWLFYYIKKVYPVPRRANRPVTGQKQQASVAMLKKQ